MKQKKFVEEEALEEEVTLKGRIFALTMRLLALGLIVLSLMLSTEGLFVVILLFVIVVPFEKLYPNGVTNQNITNAIANYERSLHSTEVRENT